MSSRPTASLRWLAVATLGLTLAGVGWLVARSREADGDDRLRLASLRRRLRRMAGTARIRVRSLGGGIVELVGELDDSDLASRLREEAAQTEGVEVVVNRLWTGGGRSREGRNRPIDANSEPR